MSWRTVIIANRCKLDLKMGYMVVRGEETKRVFLDEIDILLIENPAVSLTGCGEKAAPADAKATTNDVKAAAKDVKAAAKDAKATAADVKKDVKEAVKPAGK